jgi:hypothetical protein
MAAHWTGSTQSITTSDLKVEYFYHQYSRRLCSGSEIMGVSHLSSQHKVGMRGRPAQVFDNLIAPEAVLRALGVRKPSCSPSRCRRTLIPDSAKERRWTSLCFRYVVISSKCSSRQAKTFSVCSRAFGSSFPSYPARHDPRFCPLPLWDKNLRKRSYTAGDTNQA